MTKKGTGSERKQLRPRDNTTYKLPVMKNLSKKEVEEFYNWLNSAPSINSLISESLLLRYRVLKQLQNAVDEVTSDAIIAQEFTDHQEIQSTPVLRQKGKIKKASTKSTNKGPDSQWTEEQENKQKDIKEQSPQFVRYNNVMGGVFGDDIEGVPLKSNNEEQNIARTGQQVQLNSTDNIKVDLNMIERTLNSIKREKI